MVSKAWARLARNSGHSIALAAFAVAALKVQAAEIYASIDAGGNARYATQRLDPSYKPLFREAPEAGKAGTADVLPVTGRMAQRHGVSRELVAAIARTESNFNAHAVSGKGARGAMQLMPQTAARYGLNPAQSLDAERNIDAGVRYLKELLAHYRGNTVLALAAYNAGPRAVDRHGQRVPPYGETMLYVPSVLARAASTRDAAR